VKVVIFGGTGPTGILTLTRALQTGHHVVIYARDPSKVKYNHPNISLVKGELSDEKLIARTLQGADAVISLLGPKGKSTTDLPLAQGMKHIVAGMRMHNVKRLIATATPSASDPGDDFQFGFSAAVWMIRNLMRTAYDEIVSIAQTVRNSGLEWTLIRLPMLTDKPEKNPIKVGHIGDGSINLFWLNRSDLANFLVKQLDDTSLIHKAPAVSN